MGRKTTPGLFRRRGTWHIDKVVHGRRLRESCETGDIEEAERYLNHRIQQIRNAAVYGIRPRRTFREAATKFLLEEYKRSLHRDAQDLALVVPFIGSLALDQVHMETLKPFIAARRKAGVKSGTVNRTFAVVRRVLNLASRLWRDENGLSWLETPPLIRFVDWNDRRRPYPLSWEEQDLLFQQMPKHLATLALFKVNTGLREQEVCGLRWQQEQVLPSLGTSVFVIPESEVKNKEDRLVVLNSIATSVIEAQRGLHPVWVFPHRGKRITKIYNSAWKHARDKAAAKFEETFEVECPYGFANIRVHDLKHTFGRRLRAAGVPLETRKALLGHKNGDITTHYSAVEITELLEAAERVCLRTVNGHGLVLIRGGFSPKSPQISQRRPVLVLEGERN
ncbi:MAG: tyrosine-type recombinase/integrase [Proteobacteria bacterium]|nr:tyrosine-type recombinase/integrase [Pseudomonadota bacterium]